jgi:hypothetical protein
MISVMSSANEYWFPSKTYGWGWGLPLTWQGWIVYVAFGMLLAGAQFIFPPTISPWVFFACVITLVAYSGDRDR